jgi:hypothetical protein
VKKLLNPLVYPSHANAKYLQIDWARQAQLADGQIAMISHLQDLLVASTLLQSLAAPSLAHRSPAAFSTQQSDRMPAWPIPNVYSTGSPGSLWRAWWK